MLTLNFGSAVRKLASFRPANFARARLRAGAVARGMASPSVSGGGDLLSMLEGSSIAGAEDDEDGRRTSAGAAEMRAPSASPAEAQRETSEAAAEDAIMIALQGAPFSVQRQ